MSEDAPASCSGFALLPDAFHHRGLGAGAFARVQRPWIWARDGGWGRALTRVLGAELALPQIVETRRSSDGATTLALGLPDGAVIETVHMPRAVGSGRVTVCVSSQVGCALGCSFCATARLGLTRQLTAGELVAQVLVAVAELGPRHPGELTLVFMGMGEPLQNLPNVARAVEVLCHPDGLGLSPRRITVSTAGLVPEIERFAVLPLRPLLAVSLNATTDALRRELMPIGRRYALDRLRGSLEAYPLRARERITVEYVLLAGINDHPEDARRLAAYCAGFPHNLNLIPFNASSGSAYQTPTEARIEAFVRAVLDERPTLVTVRRSRGRDVRGACGQLATLRRRPSEPRADA